MTTSRRLLAVCLGLSAILLSCGFATAQHLSIRYGTPRLTVQAEVGRHNGGHWRTQRERVWVPGPSRVIHVPSRWGCRYDACGRRVRVLIEPAHQRVVQEPGHWEWRTTRVWVPDRDQRRVARVSRSWPHRR